MLLATNNQVQPIFSLEASISSTMFSACFDIYPHDTNRRWFSNYIKYSNYNTCFIYLFFFFLELHLPMWQHFVLSNYGPFGKLAHTFIRFLFAEFVNWEDYRDISQLWTLDLIQTIA